MTQFFDPAPRVGLIPPYLFKTIDDKKAEVKARGVDIIDLGVGDPDLPTPAFIVQKMAEAIHDPETHRYPAYSGMNLFREAVARWYRRRFGVELDPESEVLTLIGSKEGIAPLPLGINHPTAAVADKAFFARVVDFCQEYKIIAVHDAAYTELAFDGFKPPSFLEIPGAKEIGIEFHSLSKTYNMTGWRLGMAVGNREVLAALGKIKSNIDSGAFNDIQIAGR